MRYCNFLSSFRHNEHGTTGTSGHVELVRLSRKLSINVKHGTKRPSQLSSVYLLLYLKRITTQHKQNNTSLLSVQCNISGLEPVRLCMKNLNKTLHLDKVWNSLPSGLCDSRLSPNTSRQLTTSDNDKRHLAPFWHFCDSDTVYKYQGPIFPISLSLVDC